MVTTTLSNLQFRLRGTIRMSFHMAVMYSDIGTTAKVRCLSIFVPEIFSFYYYSRLKIFRDINFRSLGRLRKYFNSENFQIYGICVLERGAAALLPLRFECHIHVYLGVPLLYWHSIRYYCILRGRIKSAARAVFRHTAQLGVRSSAVQYC